MSREYWRVSVEEIMSEHGFDLSDAQIDALANDFEAAHEMCGESTGQHIASANLHSEQCSQMSALRQELQAERDKVPCKECKGGTLMVPGMNNEWRQADCWKCNGTGRHAA